MFDPQILDLLNIILLNFQILETVYHSREVFNLSSIEIFVKFPISTTNWTTMADSNWGHQDQSKPPKDPPKLPLFQTRSVSGFVVMNASGPVAWSSKRQKITARSTAEAEIYTTDEAVKQILQIHN